MDYIFCVVDARFSDGRPACVEGVWLVDGWYFWDEVSDYHGPFNTYEETIAAMRFYSDNL